MALDSQRTILEVEAFPAFRPLLEACKEYAAISGGRFLSSDFRSEDADGRPAPAETRHAVSPACKDTALAFEVALQEAQAVNDTASGLLQEVREAYRLCMSESVRNGMKATLSQLHLWPPAPELLGDVTVDENDCAYEDMSNSLPVIAQQCFNDEQRRMQGRHASEISRRTVTASFLVDFAVAAGMQLTTMPETQRIMLEEFTRHVEEWTRGQALATSRARAAFLNGLGFNPAADVARSKVAEWWKDNWQSVAWTGAAVGAIALGMAMMKRRR
jgi:hypothetical protein